MVNADIRAVVVPMSMPIIISPTPCGGGGGVAIVVAPGRQYCLLKLWRNCFAAALRCAHNSNSSISRCVGG